MVQLKNKIHAGFIVCMLFFSGCASSVYTLDEASQKGITWEVFDHPYDDVFTACVNQIQSGRAVIENVDRDSGIITTDWLQDDSAVRQFLVGGQRSRLSLNVIRLNEDQTRVNVRMFWQSQGSFGSWQENAITPAMAEESITPFFESIRNRLDQ